LPVLTTTGPRCETRASPRNHDLFIERRGGQVPVDAVQIGPTRGFAGRKRRPVCPARAARAMEDRDRGSSPVPREFAVAQVKLVGAAGSSNPLDALDAFGDFLDGATEAHAEVALHAKLAAGHGDHADLVEQQVQSFCESFS